MNFFQISEMSPFLASANTVSGGDKPTMTSMSSMSLKEEPRLEENKIEETTTLNNEGTEKDEIVVKKSAANAQKSTHGK